MRWCCGSGRLAVLLAAAALGGGCQEDRPAPHIVALEGTVRSIDRKHQTVNVHLKLDNPDRELDRTVEVTKDTEILINGAIARLEDVRVGEKATGTVKIIDEKDERRYVAVRVRIDRGESVPSSRPATRNADSNGPPPASRPRGSG